MARRVLPFAVWVGVLGWFLASAAGAEPFAYVLIQPLQRLGPLEAATELHRMDLADGSRQAIGSLGVRLTAAQLALSRDGILYAVGFETDPLTGSTGIGIYRLDRATGLATRFATGTFQDPGIVGPQGLTVDERGDLWIAFCGGPLPCSGVLYRFEVATLDLFDHGFVAGTLAGLAFRDGLLWSFRGFVPAPQTSPGAVSIPPLSLVTVNPEDHSIELITTEVARAGALSFGPGGLWELTLRRVSPPQLTTITRLDPATGQGVVTAELELPETESLSPTLAVLPLAAVPAIPTLGSVGLALLGVVLLGLGLLRLARPDPVVPSRP